MANPASLLSYDPNADTTDDLVSQINTEMVSKNCFVISYPREIDHKCYMFTGW